MLPETINVEEMNGTMESFKLGSATAGISIVEVEPLIYDEIRKLKSKLLDRRIKF